MKWVCVTKVWDSFTYGKIYEGESVGSLLDVPNDMGEMLLPSLYGIYKMSSDPNKSEKYYYFITLEEWRKQRINNILCDESPTKLCEG